MKPTFYFCIYVSLYSEMAFIVAMHPLNKTGYIICRFNDLAWAPFVTETHPGGLIIGCGESGHTSVFDASSLQGNFSLANSHKKFLHLSSDCRSVCDSKFFLENLSQQYYIFVT